MELNVTYFEFVENRIICVVCVYDAFRTAQ